MSDISDLPYVRGEDRNVPSTPVVEVNLGNWFDASGTLGAAGVAIDLFEPHLGFTVLSRNIQNINDEGNIWINIFGDDAGIATPGSYKISPGAMFDIPTRGRVSICGDLPDLKFTAGEA